MSNFPSFLLLPRFRSTESAVDFYKAFNGVPYKSQWSLMSHVVWVSNIVWGEDVLNQLPSLGHTELPICTVVSSTFYGNPNYHENSEISKLNLITNARRAIGANVENIQVQVSRKLGSWSLQLLY